MAIASHRGESLGTLGMLATLETGHRCTDLPSNQCVTAATIAPDRFRKPLGAQRQHLQLWRIPHLAQRPAFLNDRKKQSRRCVKCVNFVSRVVVLQLTLCIEATVPIRFAGRLFLPCCRTERVILQHLQRIGCLERVTIIVCCDEAVFVVQEQSNDTTSTIQRIRWGSKHKTPWRQPDKGNGATTWHSSAIAGQPTISCVCQPLSHPGKTRPCGYARRSFNLPMRLLRLARTSAAPCANAEKSV